MQVRKQGRNYIIKTTDDFIYKVNKKEVDKKIEKLLKLLTEIDEEKKELENDYYVSKLLSDANVFDEYNNVDYRLHDSIDSLLHLKEILISAENEDFEEKKSEPFWTLTTEGFNLDFRGDISSEKFPLIFSKTIEDTDEKEVVEEVIISQDSETHRLRTIIWEKTDFGRSSKEIVYRNLKTSKNLQRAIDGTRKETEEKNKLNRNRR